MIIVRMTFRAKYGQAGAMVQHYKQHEKEFQGLFDIPTRIMTDLSGPFDTLVLEQQVESIDHYEQVLQKMFASPDAMKLFEPLQAMIESGSREFYRIELESK